MDALTKIITLATAEILSQVDKIENDSALSSYIELVSDVDDVDVEDEFEFVAKRPMNSSMISEASAFSVDLGCFDEEEKLDEFLGKSREYTNFEDRYGYVSLEIVEERTEISKKQGLEYQLSKLSIEALLIPPEVWTKMLEIDFTDKMKIERIRKARVTFLDLSHPMYKPIYALENHVKDFEKFVEDLKKCENQYWLKKIFLEAKAEEEPEFEEERKVKDNSKNTVSFIAFFMILMCFIIIIVESFKMFLFSRN